jgi:hypothetical protein
MPQFEYDHPIAFEGQIATGDARAIKSRNNELLAQEDDWGFGAAVTGTYTLQIVGEEGTFTLTYDATVPPDANTDIIDGLIASAGADLLNIATLTNADPTLEIRFLHPGQVYTLTITSDPDTTTLTQVQAAGGTDIELGVVVKRGSGDDFAIAVAPGDTDADFIGITTINIDTRVSDGIQTSETVFEPGSTLSIFTMGEIWVVTEDAVTQGGQVFVRITATGTERFGAMRSDADGGDAIVMTNATWATSTTAAGLARVWISRP